MSNRTLNASGVDELPGEREGHPSVIDMCVEQIAKLNRENELLRKQLYRILSEHGATEAGRLAMEGLTGCEVIDHG